MRRFSCQAPLAFVILGMAVLANRVSAGDAAVTSFVFRSGSTVNNLNATLTPSGSAFHGSGGINKFGRVVESGKLFVTRAPLGTHDAMHASMTVILNGGDMLFLTLTGQVNTRSGVLTGSVAITGGTGRFANASGSGGFSGQIDTFWNFNAPMLLTIIGTIQ
jgi:hypothetical protein